MNTSASRPDDDISFISTAEVTSRELRLCVALIAISAVVFVGCAPFVRAQLPSSVAFVASYNSISALAALATAIILFGQFAMLRSWAMLLLASGYLFASLLSLVQLLTFPGVFAEDGLLGAGPQTALWLCIFWHGGFPITVIIYALFHDDGRGAISPSYPATATAVVVVAGAVLACWLAATWGTEHERVLPSLLNQAGFTPAQRIINLTDIVLSLAAFALLAKAVRRRLLNAWLFVVMGYWLCDITLSSYLNLHRYDFGFYAGRVYGALATSFLLAVLLAEHSRLYRQLAITALRSRERAAQLSHANRTLKNEIVHRQHTEEELRRLQAELARVSQVTAMGELTCSLADEVNHPIGAVILNAETCLRWLSSAVPDVEKARNVINAIVRDGLRASEIVGRIRQLFESTVPVREPVNVNELIRGMIALLHAEAARHSVLLRMELMETHFRVEGDPTRLRQVLMNLMINSIEAMSSTEGPRELTITSELTENEYITVCISDTGVGLPPLPANQIFKTFFTTKRNGIGLGLSISRTIVEEHGGQLWGANNPSHGAKFCMTLPIARTAP